jgi:cytochrome c oxidase assembly protein Cox11
MRFLQNRLWMLVAVLALLISSAAFAATKKYQVTGKVLGFDDKMITVEKGDEKWEIERDANTKIEGNLKIGEKVTIEYKMTATSVEVKKAK